MPIRLFFALFVLAAFAAIAPGSPAARAQVSPEVVIPPGADPGTLDRRLPPVPEGAAPDTEIPAPPDRPAPSPDDEVRFTFDRIALDGVTVYNEAEVGAILSPLVGTPATLAEVMAAAQRLTARYRADGYFLAQVVVPAQEIADGTLRLQALEGFVDRVATEGDQAADWRAAAAAYLKPAIAERPLREETLERQLLLLGDLPGVDARAVLAPSADVAAAADLRLIGERRRVNLFGGVDNRGTEFNGPIQYSLGGRWNGIFGIGDALQARGVTSSPFSEMKFGELGYQTAVGTDGWNIGINYARSLTKPGFRLAPLDVVGQGTTIRLQAEYPWIRLREEDFRVGARFTVRNVRTTVLGGTEIADDRLRVLSLRAAYAARDRWRGVSALEIEISQGLDVINASETGSADLSRAAGRSDFTKIAGSATRVQMLGGGFSLFADLGGQYALAPVLASEEYGLGGVRFGRAYDSYEISGDDGVAFRGEGRYRLAVSQFPGLDYVEFFTGFDAGTVWRHRPPDSRGRGVSLASTGAGLRIGLASYATASLEFGLPLTLDPLTEGDGDPRFFFSLTAAY